MKRSEKESISIFNTLLFGGIVITFIIIFFICAAIKGHSQTPWTDSLVKWNNTKQQKAYGWFGSLTTAQKTTYALQEFDLQMKVAIETYKKNVADTTGQAQAQIILTAQQRANSITFLKNKGFKADGSLEDWQLLWEKKKEFLGDPATHVNQISAYYQAGVNSGDPVGFFITICKNYIK